MNYETAIELAHQRMREIGKSKDEYHIEPVTIIGTELERENGEIILKAYNEYYYLVNYENYFGFIILSDSGFFNADDYSENTYQEFTGIIKILKKGDVWNMSNTILMNTPIEQNLTLIQALQLLSIQKLRAIDFIKVTIH
jgi:hypothetical protein